MIEYSNHYNNHGQALATTLRTVCKAVKEYDNPTPHVIKQIEEIKEFQPTINIKQGAVVKETEITFMLAEKQLIEIHKDLKKALNLINEWNEEICSNWRVELEVSR